MAIALVKSASGISALATTTASFASATTAGNLIVLAFASDDYNGTPGTGWTQSTGMEQQTFHGGYLWWRISTGETNFSYTIGSATSSSWVLQEFSGVDATPYDISAGQFAQSSAASYTTQSITPTTGGRLLVAAHGGSSSSLNLSTAYTTWLNSFTAIANSGQASGAATCMGTAYRLVTGNGATSFSTGATYPTTVQSRSGLIIAFKEAAGGGSIGSGDGASAGAATAQATGASNRAAAGASSGVATAQATGASKRAGAGASAGAATAQATGSAVIPAVGASSGIATAQATGDVAGSVGSGAGASAGIATAQATGAATSAASGAGSGVATAQATGSAIFAAVGAVAGTSTASAVGEAQAAGSGVGSASGSSTAQATGASIAAATGTSSGAASVTGIAYSDTPVAVQGDGDILGRQFAAKRSKRDKDPRSAMQRLIDQFVAANAPKVKNAPKAVQSAVKAGEKAAQTIIPKLAPYVAPATLVRWDEALDELRQSQAREAQRTEQLTKAISALRDLEQQAREAEDEDEAVMLLFAA